MEMDREEDLTATGRRTPRWARLSSWLIAVAVWIWVINGTLVSDWPSWSVFVDARALQWGSLALNIVFFVMAATVMAAFAMFLVRIIGRVAAWLKLRF
jgi:hypothetical protein